MILLWAYSCPTYRICTCLTRKICMCRDVSVVLLENRGPNYKRVCSLAPPPPLSPSGIKYVTDLSAPPTFYIFYLWYICGLCFWCRHNAVHILISRASVMYAKITTQNPHTNEGSQNNWLMLSKVYRITPWALKSEDLDVAMFIVLI